MKIIFIISMLLLCVFQTSKYAEIFAIEKIKPNLAMIGLLYFAFTRGPFAGEILGFGIGLTLDILISLESRTPLGIHAFVFTITGMITGHLKNKFYSQNILFIFILVFVASFFSETLVIILNIIFVSMPDSAFEIIRTLSGFSFYNALLAPIFFYIANKIFRFQKEKAEQIY